MIKKIRAVMKSKGEAGEHLCSNPPYGYMKDPDNKKHWIVDEEATKVVRRIFRLCLEGYGPTQADAGTANKRLDNYRGDCEPPGSDRPPNSGGILPNPHRADHRHHDPQGEIFECPAGQRRLFCATPANDRLPPAHPRRLPGRTSQSLCKPPVWCRIEAPHRRNYI